MAGDQSISSAATACLAGKRVLVVEDTWVVAKALQSLLEEAGLVVSGPSATIADAERLVSERVPQLAIVDLRLNGEIAHDLINCLHDRGVPVVVVSGLPAIGTIVGLLSRALAAQTTRWAGLRDLP